MMKTFRRQQDVVQICLVLILAVLLGLCRPGFAADGNSSFDLRKVTAELIASSPKVRAVACRKISDQGPAALPLLPLLISRLDDQGKVEVTTTVISGNSGGGVFRSGPIAVRQFVIDALVSFGEPAVPVLLETLGKNTATMRGGAALALGRIKTPHAFPALQKALGDSHEQVRGEVILGLKHLGVSEAEPLIRERLNDPSALVRTICFETLGELKKPDSFEAMLEVFRRERFAEPRVAGAQALREYADPRAEAALATALLDGVGRMAAVRALGSLKPGAENATMTVLLFSTLEQTSQLSDGLAVVAALQNRNGRAAIEPELARRYPRLKPEAQRAVLKSLREVESVPGLEILAAALENAQTEMRCAAAESLAGKPVPDEGLQRRLWNYLFSSPPAEFEPRAAVAKALAVSPGMIADPAILAQLGNLISREKSGTARSVYVQILEKRADKVSFLPMALKALKTPGKNRRVYAELLGKWRESQVIPVLFDALDDADADFRQAARTVLGSFPLGPETEGAFVAALRSPKADVRNGVSYVWKQARGGTKSAELLQALIGCLMIETNEDTCRNLVSALLDRFTPEETLPGLSAAYSRSTAVSRPYLVRVVARYKKPLCLPFLWQVLKDRSEPVRREAGEGLRDLPHSESVPHLIAALKTSDLRTRGDLALALKIITKKDLGKEYLPWAKWLQAGKK